MEKTTPLPKLYNYFRSSASWRVRIALNLKKIKYEYIALNILKNEQKGAEYMKLNPMKVKSLLFIKNTQKLNIYFNFSMCLALKSMGITSLKAYLLLNIWKKPGRNQLCCRKIRLIERKSGLFAN